MDRYSQIVFYRSAVAGAYQFVGAPAQFGVVGVAFNHHADMGQTAIGAVIARDQFGELSDRFLGR